MIKLSVVIITLNEEKSIAKTLESVKWCDVIIVVDSGSIDKTTEICKNFGCKVYHNNFVGFGKQKQFAVEKTENNWILSLDADEIVTEELKDEIISILRSENLKHNAYSIPFSFVFLGKLMKWGHLYGAKHIRFFNKRHANFNSSIIHEGVATDYPIGEFFGHIIHNSYESIEEYFSKFNLYTSKAAYSLFERKKKCNKFSTILRMPLTFVKIYLIYGCIFDGFPGLIWSLFSSFYPTVKYLKLIELYQNFPEL